MNSCTFQKEEKKIQVELKEEDQKCKADEKTQALKAKKQQRLKKKQLIENELQVTQRKARGDMNATVESDLCCVSFGSYQEDNDTGRGWLQWSCNIYEE